MEILAQANVTNPILGPGLSGLSGVGFLQRLLPALVAGGLVIGVVIFFFMLLIGAIQWITSGGDKAAAEAARGKITNAIVGLVILLSLFAIIQLLETFFGISLMQLDIGPLIIGSAGNGGNGVTPPPGVGNAACPCSAALGGGCATTGTVAVGPASECYRCTAGGWSRIEGSCSPISCGLCP